MTATERTHVALLRGVNVSGANRVSMPALREVVEALGHGQVVTYLQSGNVVFAARQPGTKDATIARSLGAAVAERLGVHVSVIVVRASELAGVVGENPFPAEADHRLLHVVFLPEPPDDAGVAAVAAAVARAREKGSRDDARVVGRALYLWTPDGFGRQCARRGARPGRHVPHADARRHRAQLGDGHRPPRALGGDGDSR